MHILKILRAQPIALHYMNEFRPHFSHNVIHLSRSCIRNILLPQYLGSLKWLRNCLVLKTMRWISRFKRKRHQNHPTIIGGEIDKH